jgi:hypothetical protein
VRSGQDSIEDVRAWAAAVFPQLFWDLFQKRKTVVPEARLTRCRIVPISAVLKAGLSPEGWPFETSRRRDVKLILPLATLAGAITLLFNSWGALSLSYL